VPLALTTVTSTIPVPAEEVAVIDVLLFTINVEVAEPKSTAVVEVNPAPAMTTAVPPIAGPAVGEILETVEVAAKTLLVSAPTHMRTTIAAKNPKTSVLRALLFIEYK
jgi:hypothetical protein